MWQGIKARLGRRSKAGEDSRHHARIARQAKEAEKTITRSASRELLEWEQSRGYQRMTTSQQQQVLTPWATREGAASPASSQRTASQQNRPSISHRRSISTAKTAAEVEQPYLPPVVYNKFEYVQPSAPQEATPPQSVGERDRLLSEIDAIRKSIDQLRSSTPILTLDVDDDALAAPQRPGMARAHTSSPVARHAPWLTKDRSPRPSSVFVPSPSSAGPLPTSKTPSGSRQRRKSVADLFEQDAPRPPQPLQRGPPSSPSPVRTTIPLPAGLQHLEEQGSFTATVASQPRPSSPQRQHTSVQQPERRRTKSSASGLPTQSSHPSMPRSTSFHRLDAPASSGMSIAPPLPLDAQGKIAAMRGSSPTPGQAPPAVLFPQPRPPSQPRRIIDTPQEARARLSTAMGRSPRPGVGHDAPVKRHSMYAGGSKAGLTMSELQERHQAKLRELQAPANARVQEAWKLSEAKAEWEARMRRERKEQEVRAAQAAQISTRAADQEEIDVSANRPQEEGGASTPLRNSIYANLPVGSNTRQEGAQRAHEWRKSLVSIARPGAALDSGPDEFGQHRSGHHQRSKSSLSLAPSSNQQQQLHPQPAQHAQRRPEGARREAGERAQSMFGRMPLRHTPEQSSIMMPPEELRGQPERQQSHLRQLTATDLRRMREGAGRRHTMVLA